MDLRTRVTFVIVALTILTAGPLLGLAWYLWHLGQRILRTEQYPPPGLKVVRDTLVVRGPAAGRRGRFVQLCAVVLGAAAVLLAVSLGRVFASLVRI